MGIIDVNIEKPAFKREDVSETVSEAEESQSASGSGRGRRAVKTLGAFLAAVVGVLTLRKLRARRRRE